MSKALRKSFSALVIGSMVLSSGFSPFIKDVRAATCSLTENKIISTKFDTEDLVGAIGKPIDKTVYLSFFQGYVNNADIDSAIELRYVSNGKDNAGLPEGIKCTKTFVTGSEYSGTYSTVALHFTGTPTKAMQGHIYAHIGNKYLHSLCFGVHPEYDYSDVTSESLNFNFYDPNANYPANPEVTISVNRSPVPRGTNTSINTTVTNGAYGTYYLYIIKDNITKRIYNLGVITKDSQQVNTYAIMTEDLEPGKYLLRLYLEKDKTFKTKSKTDAVLIITDPKIPAPVCPGNNINITDQNTQTDNSNTQNAVTDGSNSTNQNTTDNTNNSNNSSSNTNTINIYVMPSPMNTVDQNMTNISSVMPVNTAPPVIGSPVPTATAASYTIKYKANISGKVYDMPQDAKVSSPKATVAAAPTNVGKFFAGWSTAKDGSDKLYKPGETITLTGNTTLYAQWDKYYTAPNKLRYKASGLGTATCVGCESSAKKDIKIPNSFKCSGINYKVTAIGNDAFKNSSSLCTVIIPDSVVSIKNNAFFNCPKLNRVDIGKGLQSIGTHAFCKAKNKCTIVINSKKLSTVKAPINHDVKNMTVKVPGSKLNAYKKMLTKDASGISVKAK